MLPMHAAVDLVIDEAIDPIKDKPNRRVKAHLAAPLDVGGFVLAKAGTLVNLRVTGLRKEPGTAAPVEDVAVDGLPIVGGLLPLRATAPIGAHPSGSALATVTLASVDASDVEHVQIKIPLPLVLSTDAPHGEFTPIPLKTPTPVIRPTARATRAPSPSPSPAPSASPQAESTSGPTANALPSAAPSASPTP